MCSAFKFKNCFGRNFDYEKSYNEQIIILPPKDNSYPTNNHIIGIGIIVDDYPLFYDGMNDKGLCVAGLSFPNNAIYNEYDDENIINNIPSYDIPLFFLSNCETINQAKGLCESLAITGYSFEDLPASPLHWIISDKKKSIVLEATEKGVKVYDNPFEILTNNPPFPMMQNTINKTIKQVGKLEDATYKAEAYSRGTETINLKGDYTSISRFNRLAYLKQEMLKQNKFNTVNESFHLLESVEQCYGLTPVKEDYEYTIYSAVYDTINLELYVKAYNYLDYGIKVHKLERLPYMMSFDLQ